MNIYHTVKLGIVDMWGNKGRTFITMLGIILGAMSIVAVLSIVQGGRQQSLKFLEESGGALKLSIEPKWSFDIQTRQEVFQQRLTLEDLRAIQRYFSDLEYISPTLTTRSSISYKGDVFRSRLNGVLPEYQYVENFFPQEGRFITDFDNKSASRVAVIGTTIKEVLFGDNPCIGETITINDNKFSVIGVMEHKEISFGASQFNPLERLNRSTFIPLATMDKILYPNRPLSSVDIQVASADMVMPTKERLEQFLLALRNGNEVFEVRAASDQLEEIETQTAQTQIVFLLIGGISLLVGGIVIANIMLATVKERMNEIGIRMALGATRRDILLQFLLQALLVSIIGAIIGILIGLSLLNILANVLQSPTVANFQMIVMAIGLSCIVGFVAGLFPAVSASRANPIEILRYE
ncbi:MAG: ABC transporter permease [Candidatus Cloacimonadia bacterium]